MFICEIRIFCVIGETQAAQCASNLRRGKRKFLDRADERHLWYSYQQPIYDPHTTERVIV